MSQPEETPFEVNFDGLVGPTHYFAGLSHGNVASEHSEGHRSHPKKAALEGLAKMRALMELGVEQAVLPPQARPDLRALSALGFSGPPERVLAEVARREPALLRAVSSASSMWAANAATMAPACDSKDGRLHLVVANLRTMFHRSLEAETTFRVLSTIFADEKRYAVHQALPGGEQFADEGAANHTRLASSDGRSLHLLAWGRSAWAPDGRGPKRYPARQTREASAAVARLLELGAEQTYFPRQHAAGIDGGAFHTDVVAVGHQDLWLAHELAFEDPSAVQEQIRGHFDDQITQVWVTESELPLADAVAAYPFNSQLVTPRGAKHKVVIAPVESRENPRAHAFFERLLAEHPNVREVRYLDVRQSMKNGGGPACLRQRILLCESDRANLHARGIRVWLDEQLLARLETWVQAHYREELSEADLADPALCRESFAAIDALTGILGLGSIYDFQR